jgi:hypothetical protein
MSPLRLPRENIVNAILDEIVAALARGDSASIVQSDCSANCAAASPQ